MNELQIFNNPEFGAIRTVEIDGEPWLVGKDVCAVFGDKNHNRSLGRVDAEDKRVVPITDSMGRTQQITIINESGLYAHLFAMQPQKANNGGVSDAYPIEIQERIDRLRKFKRWITHEVIPSIRKHGAYMTPETLDRMITSPEFGIKLLTALKDEQEKRKALEVQAEKNRPKVLFADSVAASKSSILVREMAKLLKQNGVHTGQNRLFETLREKGFLIKRQGTDYNTPTQKAMEMGLFEIKETVINHSDGHTSVNKTPKVTGKGQQYFVNMFLGGDT
ncbi:phage antirepressor KilAC domain-containing protein [Oscillospiraceae bacterium 38-13]